MTANHQTSRRVRHSTYLGADGIAIGSDPGGALTYVGAALPAGGCRNDGGLNSRYTITVDTLTQNTYRVVATPIGAQLARDTACGTLTLDQTGERGKSGSSDVTQCWSR